MRSFVAIIALLLVFAPAVSAGEMKRYDGKYYIVYTDLDPEAAREAVLRMTRMADEYRARTAGFSGELTTKLPFYLYQSPDDFFRAGGLPNTSGVFITDETGGRLMAIAGRHPDDRTWHTVQHEGFHQFAHAVISGKLPTWLDEGLAEYFGESVFTGDGFVTGVIPPWRLARLKREMAGRSLKPPGDLMALSADKWREEMSLANYDQAWSMVYFLVHADHGKYQDAFAGCIRDVAGGKAFAKSWADRIGPADRFERCWTDYWIAQPASPTSVLYGKVAVATLTSFLGRATAQKQTFTDYAAFRSSADGGKLKIADNDWLPPSLLREMSRLADEYDGWSLLPPVSGNKSELLLVMPDGTRLTGLFSLSNLKVDKVTVDIDDVAPVLAEARKSVEAGKNDQARAALTAALKDHPKSPAAADARKFLAGIKGN